ncbi:MAG: site-specific integrase [Melioribacteraceae bacterium]
MASIFCKRGYLWLGWYEYDSYGKKNHPQIPLNLKDNKLNRKIAEDYKKQKEYELRFTSTTYITKITLEDAIKEFIYTKKHTSKNTIAIYLFALEKLKTLDKKYLKDITEKDMQLLIDKFKAEGKSEETIRTYTRHQKIFFNDAIKKKLLTSNPVNEYKTKSNNVVKVINEEELEAIFQFFKKRNLKHYYFLRILNSTGLRISEAIALKWNDINYKGKTITINNTKGKRAEEIPLLEETEQIFKEIEYESEYIFNYKNTNSLKAIKRQLTKFGYTFHDFRRTFGTRWSKELKPFELKKIMRHNDLRTTDKYYIHNELNEIKNKMDGCYLVAEANKKSTKLFKIPNP